MYPRTRPEAKLGRASIPSMRRPTLLLIAFSTTVAAQTPLRGTIAGTVVSSAGQPVAGALVSLRAARDTAVTAEATTDSRGAFHLSLRPDVFSLVVRQLGFRPATLGGLRVVGADTVRVRVVLAPTATALSTVVVLRSPVSVETLDPQSTRRITTETALLLPTARDASAVVALVPGAKDGRLWGGAGAATNDFRIDGISMNHPGRGGDFLRLPREWVEGVEIRGLGAGAEYGNFQGGVIDAMTRRGGQARTRTVRSYYESERLTASSFGANEIGSEPAGRTEFSGEASGALAPGKVFYFAGAQFVESARRSPALGTPAPSDFLGLRERERTLRAIGKLSWDLAAGARADLTLGGSTRGTSDAGINGLDDRTALPDGSASALWYHARWYRPLGDATTLELRAAGFDAVESSSGASGSAVPSIQVLTVGDLPRYQNPEFEERAAPASHSLTAMLRRTISQGSAIHRFSAGIELSAARWSESRLRSGGLTWRPYLNDTTPWSATDASTWTTVGSEWGGELRLRARERQAAAFIQDELTLAARVTISPGLRLTQWSGRLTPCSNYVFAPTCVGEIGVVSTRAVDPRLGIAWDLTGRGTFALKAHAGRYHQGIYAQLFDRAAGANAYTNERFYYYAPPISDPRQAFTAFQRDALLGPSGFSTFFDERILNESGAVRGYRQPYVDQLSLSLERQFGTRWKLELLALHRRNGDIVGLVDRNLATNYTRLTGIAVDHRLTALGVLDAYGRPLVLDTLVVANKDLIDAVLRLNENRRPPLAPLAFAGWLPADLGTLTWDPRVELSTLPAARGRYGQLTATVTAFGGSWRGEGSLTLAHLEGNVAGVTGHGTVGTAFSAGPYVRPNESLNASGILPDATEFEAKVWVTGRLPRGLQGGLLFTHILGERTTPSFTIEGRYRYTDVAGMTAPDELIRRVLGQTIFVEPRGARHYASRSLLDLHLERGFGAQARRFDVTLDLLNALGSRAVTRVKTEIDDQAIADPSSVLGAARARVSPRALRIGLRIGAH